MTDNEIVLNLLDFYKKRGIDLYKVLDDPTFKSLSRDTQLRAIQMYANRILHGTPSGFGRNDFKSMLNSTLMNMVTGAASGAVTAFGVAKTIKGGSVPPEAIFAGAMFGGVSGAFSSGIGTLGKIRERNFIRGELHNAVENPTPSNALNVITANTMRASAGENIKKLLDKATTSGEKHIEEGSKEQVKFFVEEANKGKEKY